MVDPCLFQQDIIKHGESIAKLETLAPNIERIANNVELLTIKMSQMKGFVAGAAACGGAIISIIVWVLKSIPTFIRS